MAKIEMDGNDDFEKLSQFFSKYTNDDEFKRISFIRFMKELIAKIEVMFFLRLWSHLVPEHYYVGTANSNIVQWIV